MAAAVLAEHLGEDETAVGGLVGGFFFLSCFFGWIGIVGVWAGDGRGETHVGPAPNMRTEEPSFGAILSRPWAAQEAGSRRVASTSDKLWILKTLLFYSQFLTTLLIA